MLFYGIERMPMTTTEVEKKKRNRSPNYPYIPLDAALDKAHAIYRAEKANPAPTPALFKAMGYSGQSGPSLGSIAALKHYGLLEEQESSTIRVLRLTPTALRIIIDQETSPERVAAIKQAALSPRLFAELWQKYGKDSSNETLRVYLMLERKFASEGAALEVIKNYRKTIEFAKLETGDSAPDAGGGDEGAQTDDELITALNQSQKIPIFRPNSANPPIFGQRALPPAPGTRDFTFPLPDGVAILRVPFPMSEEGFDLLAQTLALWKPTLVKKNEKEKDPLEGL